MALQSGSSAYFIQIGSGGSGLLDLETEFYPAIQSQLLVGAFGKSSGGIQGIDKQIRRNLAQVTLSEPKAESLESYPSGCTSSDLVSQAKKRLGFRLVEGNFCSNKCTATAWHMSFIKQSSQKDKYSTLDAVKIWRKVQTIKLGFMYMASWQGRGHSFLVLANVKPLANDAKKLYVQLQIKYQYVQFIGENSTGSGLNERLGNHHHTLKGQVIMYWK